MKKWIIAAFLLCSVGYAQETPIFVQPPQSQVTRPYLLLAQNAIETTSNATETILLSVAEGVSDIRLIEAPQGISSEYISQTNQLKITMQDVPAGDYLLKIVARWPQDIKEANLLLRITAPVLQNEPVTIIPPEQVKETQEINRAPDQLIHTEIFHRGNKKLIWLGASTDKEMNLGSSLRLNIPLEVRSLLVAKPSTFAGGPYSIIGTMDLLGEPIPHIYMGAGIWAGYKHQSLLGLNLITGYRNTFSQPTKEHQIGYYIEGKLNIFDQALPKKQVLLRPSIHFGVTISY